MTLPTFSTSNSNTVQLQGAEADTYSEDDNEGSETEDDNEGPCSVCGSETKWDFLCLDCILYHNGKWEHSGWDSDADLFDRVVTGLYDIGYGRAFRGEPNSPFHVRKDLKFIVRLYMKGYQAGANARLLQSH